MSALSDLIEQIDDEELKKRINNEIDKLTKKKKFGLVFEEHLPECTPLYEVPIKKGVKVALRTGKVNDYYIVVKKENEKISCCKPGKTEVVEFAEKELVVVAEFGDPIYPYLKPIDSICNAPDSDLWHILIEADNYHALQLLEYIYAEKVDCIYIDPPYNTGARDWKYNNDYVDSNDTYRHSKWLSMMEKRLKLARKLLNPKSSVLLITIDEKEYLHLGCLLEELFPDAKMQMVSITISPSGAKRDNLFSRSDEYIYILLFGSAHVIHNVSDGNEKEIRWFYLRRTDYASRRGTKKGGVAQFYPIYVDDTTKKIVHIGDYLTPEQDRTMVPNIEGATPVFPIREDGVEMNWGMKKDALQNLINLGFVRVSDGYPLQPYIFRYVSNEYEKYFKEGRWKIIGEHDDHSKLIVETGGKVTRATTVLQNKLYDAGAYGTSLLTSLVGEGKFNFPKSLYAVVDTLNFFVSQNKNALILDFFAGSGTTMHAVNLINAIDGGNRRCISVTNNEVSEKEVNILKSANFRPGDKEWEKYGIARYVTWPRTVNAILGKNKNSEQLEGDYGKPTKDLDLGYSIPKMNGFASNAAFFKLDFLDKNSVALGLQLNEILPLLWLKSGGFDKCPSAVLDSNMYIFEKNKFAILVEEKDFAEFKKKINELGNIKVAYLITDYEKGFISMSKDLHVEKTYQLYRDYLDNFRINTGRE